MRRRASIGARDYGHAVRSTRSARGAPACEQLERRALLSADPLRSGGSIPPAPPPPSTSGPEATLQIVGSDGDDIISLHIDGPDIVYDVNGSTATATDADYDAINIAALAGNDRVTINSTGENTITIGGGLGDDAVHLAEQSRNMIDLPGDVSVSGDGGSDTLVIFDQSFGQFGETYTLTGASITFASVNVGTTTYAGLSAITLYTSLQNDAIHVESTSAPLTIFGSSGADTLRLTPVAQNLDAIDHAITFDGQGDTDSIVASDQLQLSSDSYLLTASQFAGARFPELAYTSVAGMTLYAGGGADAITVGNGTIDGMPAVTIDGGAGNDTLIVNDQLDAQDDDYDVTGSSVIRSFAAAISYVSVQSLVLHLGSGSSNVLLGDGTVDQLPAMTIGGGAGEDTIILDDRTDTHNELFTLTATTVDGLFFNGLSYADVETVAVDSGFGNDAVIVEGNTRDITTIVSAGSGNDTVEFRPPPDATSTAPVARMVVNGGAGDDTLLVDDSLMLGGASYTLSSSTLQRTLFDGLSLGALERLTLLCGPGNDTLTVTSTFNGEVSIASGPGDDLVRVQETPAGVAVNVDVGPGGADVVTVNADNVGRAAVRFRTSQRLERLELGSEGTATLAPGGDKVLVTRELQFSGAPGTTSARLNLNDNALVYDYTGATSPIDIVAALLARGRGGGTWTGRGIATDLGDATRFALGFAEASSLFSTFPATFAGESVDDTAVLVRFTRYGDANLDGQVNLQDFNRLASNFGTSTSTWSNGDFNFDGIVNLGDFNLLATNFGLAADSDEPL
jgi:hypothetical protein